MRARFDRLAVATRTFFADMIGVGVKLIYPAILVGVLGGFAGAILFPLLIPGVGTGLVGIGVGIGVGVAVGMVGLVGIAAAGWGIMRGIGALRSLVRKKSSDEVASEKVSLLDDPARKSPFQKLGGKPAGSEMGQPDSVVKTRSLDEDLISMVDLLKSKPDEFKIPGLGRVPPGEVGKKALQSKIITMKQTPLEVVNEALDKKQIHELVGAVKGAFDKRFQAQPPEFNALIQKVLAAETVDQANTLWESAVTQYPLVKSYMDLAVLLTSQQVVLEKEGIREAMKPVDCLKMFASTFLPSDAGQDPMAMARARAIRSNLDKLTKVIVNYFNKNNLDQTSSPSENRASSSGGPT